MVQTCVNPALLCCVIVLVVVVIDESKSCMSKVRIRSHSVVTVVELSLLSHLLLHGTWQLAWIMDYLCHHHPSSGGMYRGSLDHTGRLVTAIFPGDEKNDDQQAEVNSQQT